MTYWIEFANQEPGCLNGPDLDQHPELLEDPTKPFGSINNNYADHNKVLAWIVSRAKELTGEEPTKVNVLPYGSGRALDPNDDRGGWFCYSPNECKGWSSCPKRWACSE